MIASASYLGSYLDDGLVRCVTNPTTWSYNLAGEEQAIDYVGDRGGADQGHRDNRNLPQQGRVSHVPNESGEPPQPRLRPVQEAGDGQELAGQYR
jgi:hypothetical protein